MKVQDCLMQAHFIEIQQVFAKKSVLFQQSSVYGCIIVYVYLSKQVCMYVCWLLTLEHLKQLQSNLGHILLTTQKKKTLSG